MSRTRRFIEPGKPYTLILKVRRNLPFKAGILINTLIESIMARAQRDNKVTICHYLWMGNHAHFILVPHDPQAFVDFYQEIQKKLTDAFKRLLGMTHLQLWKGSAVVAQILDIEKAIEHIAYIYANPANANLVSTIDDYPGISSYETFQRSESQQPDIPKKLPWFRLPTIKKLRSRSMSSEEEYRIHSELTARSKDYHELTVSPDAWMEAFSVQDKMAVNEKIRQRISEFELAARLRREREQKCVAGASILKKMKIFCEFVPQREREEKRVFVMSSSNQLRMNFIKALRDFCGRCRECYRKLKLGIPDIAWPSYAFLPPAPPIVI